MSGVSSTINDSGRVYLFDRNALPKNFIESGMKLSADGLTATISTGTCDIGGKFHELASPATIALPQRMTSLLYVAKSDLADTPTFGYVQAGFPAADAGTVCRWIIDGSATIASTVGSNNLTRNGTVTQVDGWIGYGGQGNGSTGLYASANSTGFPTGAAVRESSILYTHTQISASMQKFFQYGGSSTDTRFALGLDYNSSSVVFDLYSTVVNTGYVLEVGKTYLLTAAYDGANLLLYANGSLVFSTPKVLATGSSALAVGLNAYGVIHYVELRNALRPAAQIAAISNALLLPCRYYTSETANTYTDVRAILPADTISLGRVRTSSTAIVEARMDYQDGRREGAVDGNRRVFLGWKSFSGTTGLFWENPFGTRKVVTRFVYAKDNNGRGECDVTNEVANDIWYGATPGRLDVGNRIRCLTSSAGVVYDFVEGYKTSGYIGCYAEAIE